MGTNYYWHDKACINCGRGDEPKHIGKSSAGWCFSLHVYPHENIHDLSDWERLFTKPGSIIMDEYGQKVSVVEMHREITERKFRRERPGAPFGYRSWDEFHQQNYSQPGPDGLVRHKVDGTHTVSNGAGTWDCCVGDFS